MPPGKDLPVARVDEVFSPAEAPAPAADGTSPWPWVGGGAALVALVLGLILWRRRIGGAPAPLPQ
jgi:hypothetical protein